MFAGGESVLKGLLLCLSISSSLCTDILLVKYPKAVLRKREGEALTLSCTVIYDQNMCENVHAQWCKFDQKDDCIELTEPKRYLIQVAEKNVENQVTRSRLITMSIASLTRGDKGMFQCNAECGANGLKGRGNYIELSVKQDPKRNPVKNCGIHRVEVISITLYFLLLFMSSALYSC